MAKKGYTPEIERAKQLKEQLWEVTRNSGSIGASDLIAIRISDPQRGLFNVRYEQVKATRQKTFYFNERSKDELRRLKNLQRNKLIPCYFAIKFAYKGWKIINVSKINGSPIKSEK